MTDKSHTPPLLVYKHGGIWHWRCRRWLCESTDHGAHHRLALARGLDHLNRHERVGFR